MRTNVTSLARKIEREQNRSPVSGLQFLGRFKWFDRRDRCAAALLDGLSTKLNSEAPRVGG